MESLSNGKRAMKSYLDFKWNMLFYIQTFWNLSEDIRSPQLKENDLNYKDKVNKVVQSQQH